MDFNSSNLFAFDAEWKPYIGGGQQGRISLVQLGDGRDIFLFHVHHMDQFPEELQKILESERALKVGINIRNDGRKLWRDWGVASTSLVELGALCIQVMGELDNRRKVRSMTALAEELLGHAVAKDTFVRNGNWEMKNLSARQLSYAANDAFVTYEVAQRIKDLQQRPRQPDDEEFTVPLQAILKSGENDVKTVRGTLDRIESEGFSEDDIIVPSPPSSKVAVVKKEGMNAKDRSRRQATKTTIVVAGRKTIKAASPTKAANRKREVKTKPAAALASQPPSLPLDITDMTPLPEPIVLKYTAGQWTRTIIPASSFAQRRVWQADVTAASVLAPSVSSDRPILRKDSKSTDTTTTRIVKTFKKTIEIIPRSELIRRASKKASFSTFARAHGCHVRSRASTAVPYSTGRSDGQADSEEQGEEGTTSSVPRLSRQLLPESMEHLDILERNQAVWRETAGKDVFDGPGDKSEPDDDWYLRQNEALFQSLYTSEPEEDDEVDNPNIKTTIVSNQ
ncbi:hypothetical protein DFQ27_000032 [Actinomortierella ambigua]|uniref:3'-5' exonuclease n=1 Tax=Actinomortierella ambigua TaxID=1343610 RepID=A0A9P6UDE7_9FUNG|nr:hypothetical protein DFQ27_000032 [Actinomortierella ambigua]